MADGPLDTPAALSLGVVVPTLNEAAALPRLLERLVGRPAAGPDDIPRSEEPSAVGSADHADCVVVADGGSADGTPALAARGGARVVESSAGRGGQLAAGAALLETDLLLFIHADCLPQAGALAAVRRAFSDPAVGRCAMVQAIAAPGWHFRALERCAARRARRGLVYGDCGLGLRRSLYEAVGGFQDLPIFEDLDLSQRLLASPLAGRMVLVEDAVLGLSARRWQHEGFLRCTLRNWALTKAWRLGLAPKKLARFYRPPAGEHAQ
ncbi:MAG: glycosyltransferase family 2 protein [Planctomycetota bacterium]|nr:glycosyltransferase family 2 protein [Planctomycetota bacterium]